MRKILISLILILSCFSAKAQMTRWIMQPGYDKIYIATGAPLFICDSLDTSSIWSMKGERLAVTNDIIHPFKEGLSVTTKKNEKDVTGFFNSQGKFTSLKNFSVTYNEPFFKDGYLLVQSDDRYCFINENGEEEEFGSYVKMYPFSNGYATCFTYEQVDKLKNPYYTYITVDNSPMTFFYNDKVLDKEDVEFLSSVNDEGVAIAVVKHKVYLFDKNARKLEPVFSNRNETNVKRQVTVDGDITEYLLDMNDSIIVQGKGSKKEFVRFTFDKMLRLTKIKYADRTKEYKLKSVEAEKYTSLLSSIKENEKYGFTYHGETILPVQFDEVGFCLNDFAVVRIDNKWGMLAYDPNLKYRLIIHNGKDIAFRHKDVATTVKLELPVVISADKCRFDIDEKYGCIIDKISLETKNTENGNYVQYNCNLAIPDSLPDVITEIQYPVQITYDGLKYPIVPIKTKAWHYKYINVDLDEAETTVDKGDVSFTINISVEKQPGEIDYPFEVEIKADSLQSELAKISETRYKCKLFDLEEGVNNINIDILENGCPPSVFPFEIKYTKPKPKVKEEVKIEKKVKVKEPVKKEGPILPF